MCADTPETDPKYPVLLPETAFPMRAGLPQREPGWLARWAEIGVTEVLYGFPDRSEDEVRAYVERLAGKLAALV